MGVNEGYKWGMRILLVSALVALFMIMGLAIAPSGQAGELTHQVLQALRITTHGFRS